MIEIPTNSPLAFIGCISSRIGVSFGNEYWVTLSQSTHLSKAGTPKAVVVADSHKKFELHYALEGGTVSASVGDVLSDIGAHKIAHCKPFVSVLR